MKIQTISIGTLLCALSLAASAQEQPKPTAIVNPEVGLPVFPGDLPDHPYVVLGEVKAGVRQATVFSGTPSRQKIYAELWERARKLGADAVVKAQYGKAHVSAFSWSKANASGIAIRFLPPDRRTNTAE